MSEPEFDPALVELFSNYARLVMAEGRLAMFGLFSFNPEFGNVRGVCERNATGLVMRGTLTTPTGQEGWAMDAAWESFATMVEVGSVRERLIHLDLDWATSFMTMEIGPLEAGHLQRWAEAMEANGVPIVMPEPS